MLVMFFLLFLEGGGGVPVSGYRIHEHFLDTTKTTVFAYDP